MDYDNISDSDDEILGITKRNNNIRSSVKSQYKHLETLNDIVGYIVNVHDGINFDIDLFIPNELINKYNDVITDTYYYRMLNDSYFNTGNFDNNEIKKGKVYRCHLRGIGINKNYDRGFKNKYNIMTNEIKKLIDRVDGWVICTLLDIDIYDRLLVDIKLKLKGNTIDLKQFISKNSKFENMYREYA